MSDNGGGGVGCLSIILIGLILLGVAGLGPCAESCKGCGPQIQRTTKGE